MPEFQGREGAHQEWKQAVLSGEIQLPEIETAEYSYRTTATPTTREELDVSAS